MDSEMERLDSILEQVRKKAVVQAVDAMVREQIKIAGSQILYERINKSFKEGSMEPYFLKEQWMLYSWRERFFQHHFPLVGGSDTDSWYTDGADDSHFRDTVPFQVTTNFDCLMTMAAGMRQPKVFGEKIYLENDEEISNSVRMKWDVNPEHGFDFDDYAIGENYNELSYSFTVHQLAELHLKGPSKLEELAMRSVIKNGISLAEMSGELKKSVDGMYDLEDDAPEHIDDVGEKSFKRVKRLFTKIKAGENVTSSTTAKLKQSFCIIRPEDLVVTDSEEEEEIPTREMTSGSSNTITTTLPSLPNSTNINKRKLEEDILLERKERELQFLAWMKADMEKKKSKRGPPHPGPGQ